MDTLRVLLTAEVLRHPTTGVERYTGELIRGLMASTGVDLTVFVEEADDLQTFKPGPAAITRKVLPTPLRSFSYLTMPRRLFEGFDVIHCPIMVAPFLLSPVMRKPTGAKVVMTCHDLIPLILPEYQRLSLNLYFKWWLPRVLPHVDAFIANSEWTKRDLCRVFGTDPARVHVTHLASHLKPIAEEEVAPKDDYLLCLGTMDPRKNLRRSIEAFVKMLEKRSDLPDRLVMVGRWAWGSGPLSKAIRAAGDRIDVRGYLSDEEVVRLLRYAKGLVYPSLYEGFGLPVLEAMSLGCPVITSDRTSLPEVAGDAALYVDPEDTDALAKAMQTVLTDPSLREQMIRKGLAQAAKFSWQRCAQETVEIYRHVLEKT